RRRAPRADRVRARRASARGGRPRPRKSPRGRDRGGPRRSRRGHPRARAAAAPWRSRPCRRSGGGLGWDRRRWRPHRRRSAPRRPRPQRRGARGRREGIRAGRIVGASSRFPWFAKEEGGLVEVARKRESPRMCREAPRHLENDLDREGLVGGDEEKALEIRSVVELVGVRQDHGPAGFQGSGQLAFERQVAEYVPRAIDRDDRTVTPSGGDVAELNEVALLDQGAVV